VYVCSVMSIAGTIFFSRYNLWIYDAVSVLWLSFFVNLIYVLRSAVWYCNLIVL